MYFAEHSNVCIYIGGNSNEHDRNDRHDECVTSDNGCRVYRDHAISAEPMKGGGRMYRLTFHMISMGYDLSLIHI